METDPTRMCELLVGLPDIKLEGVADWPRWLRIVITTRAGRPCCPSCAGVVWRHDDLDVELVDLRCFGRRARLVWSKTRWRCPNPNCKVATFFEIDDRIAAGRAGITDRAGRWATFQVGHHGRSVSEVAADLGCAWFADQPVEWMAGICWATLALSGSYRSVFDTMLPDAVQIADLFHVVKLANFVLDEVRRRVQNDTLGHRGRKTDPLYRCRKLMTVAHG